VIIYLDVIILENFIVDFFLLYITCQTLKVRVNIKYTIIATIFGDIYGVLVLYPIGKYFSVIPFKMIIAFIMVAIAIKNRNLELIVKGGIIFLLYSMVLAGSCIFIALRKGEFYNISNVIINFSYKNLMLAIIVIYIAISRIVIYIRDRKTLDKLIYTVEIKFNNSQKTIRAFLDTGNELREPVTNLPVIVVEKDMLKGIVIPEDKKMVIPYKVINKQYGKLYGFIPDKVEIRIDNDDVINIKAIIAECENKLSDVGEYNALLSRGIIY